MKTIRSKMIITLLSLTGILVGCYGDGDSGSNYYQQPITSHHYSFDEENGVTVYSSSSTTQTGQISGASRAIGKINKSLYFGNDLPSYVDLTLFSEYPRNELSLEAWVKFESLDPSLVYHFYGDTGSGVSSFTMDVADNQFRFLLYTQSGTLPLEILRTNYTFGVDTWYYIALTYGGSGAKFYVNGQLNSESTTLSAIPNVYNKQYLGGGYRGGYAPNSFPGYIDEFRGSKVERTSDEISTYYQNTL